MTSRKFELGREDQAQVDRILTEVYKLGIPPPLNPEWYVQILHSEQLRGAKLFTGTTFEEMAAFVLGESGVTVEEFDCESGKSLSDLFAELEREVNLMRTKDGHIIRFASNARTEIHARLEGVSLQEVGRVLLRIGRRIGGESNPKRYASSETMLRRVLDGTMVVEESPAITAQRGLREEYGVEIPLDRLVPLVTGAPEVPPLYKSKVYTCDRVPIMSWVATWPFRLDVYSTFGFEDECPKIRRDGDLVLVQDNDVLLQLKWLPPQNRIE